MVFYNEAAAAVLGRSFEEAGQMSAAEWTAAFGPLSGEGDPLEFDEVSLTKAIREGRPAHGNFRHPDHHQPRAADRGGRLPDRRLARGQLGGDDHVLAAGG